MLLATGPSLDFMKFFQVLSWIILSIGLPAVLLTVFLHYRSKKRSAKKMASGNEDELIQSSPELLGYTRGDGEYVFFDHSTLISEYKKRLSHNHARYTALKRDFEQLESKYVDLADYTALTYAGNKMMGITGTTDSMPKALQKEMAKFASAYKAEKEELLSRLERMNHSYRELEAESQALQDQIKIQTATEDERSAILHRWKEENTLLKEKLTEQQYVHDLLAGKKAQIIFLQDQLEQKIKDNHQLDQQRTIAAANLEAEREQQKNLRHTIEELKNELLQKQEEADKLNSVVCSKEEQLSEKQDRLKTKEEQVAWLENTWNGSKQQNIDLGNALAESRNSIAVLQQQLLDEQARRAEAEQNLAAKESEVQQLYVSLASLSAKEKEAASAPETINDQPGNWMPENIAVH